eukprot:g2023.t1
MITAPSGAQFAVNVPADAKPGAQLAVTVPAASRPPAKSTGRALNPTQTLNPATPPRVGGSAISSPARAMVAMRAGAAGKKLKAGLSSTFSKMAAATKDVGARASQGMSATLGKIQTDGGGGAGAGVTAAGGGGGGGSATAVGAAAGGGGRSSSTAPTAVTTAAGATTTTTTTTSSSSTGNAKKSRLSLGALGKMSMGGGAASRSAASAAQAPAAVCMPSDRGFSAPKGMEIERGKWFYRCVRAAVGIRAGPAIGAARVGEDVSVGETVQVRVRLVSTSARAAAAAAAAAAAGGGDDGTFALGSDDDEEAGGSGAGGARGGTGDGSVLAGPPAQPAPEAAAAAPSPAPSQAFLFLADERGWVFTHAPAGVGGGVAVDATG